MHTLLLYNRSEPLLRVAVETTTIADPVLIYRGGRLFIIKYAEKQNLAVVLS